MAERRYRPWFPVTVRADNETPRDNREIRKCDAAALQAMHAGIANADQQRMAFIAILHICGVNDLEFLPDEHGGERETVFKSGGRFIGLQLQKLVSFPLNFLTGEINERPSHERRTGKPADGRNSDRAKR